LGKFVADDDNKSTMAFAEFVALAAMMFSLVALSVDAMLPALPDIGRDLGVIDPNQNQYVIGIMLLGLGLGQIFYGPLSDSIGRKKPIYIGISIYLVGCLICVLSTSLEVMLAGRLLQGLGVAGPRIVVVAIIRDQYGGDAMARVMSFVMTIFILVPALAPSIGQGILIVSNWRWIFGLFLVQALVALIWFVRRQPETLSHDRRRALSLRRIGRAAAEVCRHRIALGYTLIAGCIFGAFLGYLTSTQQIFEAVYDRAAQMPLYFALLAMALGAASLSNARLVMRLGMIRLSAISVAAFSLLSVGFFVYAQAHQGVPPFAHFIVFCFVDFFFIGILFGNMSAMAMEPMGHIAGVAAAVTGFITSVMSVVLGSVIGQYFDGTVVPLIGGFAVLGSVAGAIMYWVERGRQKA
jgi:DHA1 family bicyclomycin/chloramphenicol resistance-like MFS transporter